MLWQVRSVAAALLVLSAGLGSGCYKATFIDPNASAGEEHEEWTDFYIFGLVGEEEVDARRFCQGPVALVRTGGNFGTGIVTVLTIGIYAPRKVYVTCAAAPSASVRAGAAQDLVVEERAGAPVRARRTSAGGEWIGVPVPVEGAPGVWRVRMNRGGEL